MNRRTTHCLLVVDDDPRICTMLSECCEGVGFADEISQDVVCGERRADAPWMREQNDLPAPLGKDYAIG